MPPSFLGTRRSWARVSSTMGDGFCNAAGGEEICATASAGHPISGIARIILIMKRISIKNPD